MGRSVDGIPIHSYSSKYALPRYDWQSVLDQTLWLHLPSPLSLAVVTLGYPPMLASGQTNEFLTCIS